MSSWLEDYKRDGVAIIPKVFSKKWINALRAEALLHLSHGRDTEVIDGYPTILYETDDFGRGYYGAKIDSVVKTALGEDYVRVTNQYYFHLPGDPDSFAWHTDERFRPGIDKDSYLQTGIIVDDWTDENGAVEYIKGSHLKDFKNDQELRGFVRGNLKGEKIYPKSGDLAIWSAFIVHGSEPNKSKYPRAYYMQGFQR